MMKSIGRFIDNFSRGSRITLGSILLRRDCDFTRCSKIRGAFRVRHFLITRRLRNSTLYLSGFPRICNYCRIVDKIGVSSPPWREKKKKIIIIKIWRIKMAFRCSIIIDSNPDVIISFFDQVGATKKPFISIPRSSPWYVNYILFFHLFTLLDNRKRRKKKEDNR